MGTGLRRCDEKSVWDLSEVIFLAPPSEPRF
jgi:hypothetical protein